jgi:hypothetical protein
VGFWYSDTEQVTRIGWSEAPMTDVMIDEMEALKAELAHYKSEKEKIRDIVGQIGGKTGHARLRIINVAFLVVVLAAFVFDVVRSIAAWHTPYLPPHLLLEIAVLLVSLKIIWMIHTQSKVDHFQFWILHSIEFQMNMLSRRVADLAKTVQAIDAPGGGAADGEESGSSDGS